VPGKQDHADAVYDKALLLGKQRLRVNLRDVLFCLAIWLPIAPCGTPAASPANAAETEALPELLCSKQSFMRLDGAPYDA
jgi:hypothetical protein